MEESPGSARGGCAVVGSLADELRGCLRAYARTRVAVEAAAPRRRGRRSERPAARRAAAARVSADGMVSALMGLDDVRSLLKAQLRPAALGQWVEQVILNLGEFSLHIGPAVRRLADLLAQAAVEACWSVQALFAGLLVPALAAMSCKKTKAFGVVLAAAKSLWVPEDWPDSDVKRATTLTAMVCKYFLDGRDLLTGVWFVTRLKLSCFPTFDDFFNLMSDRIQALRLYCTEASHGERCDVVRRLVRLALQGDRQQRRKNFSFAAQLIERFGLDRREFPEVARHKLACWMCYIVHRVPLQIAEDYANGDCQLLALCVAQLARAESTTSAALLYKKHQHELIGIVEASVLNKIQDVVDTVEPGPDAFGPAKPFALSLPLTEKSILSIEDAESARHAEKVLRSSPLLGIDLEWGSLGDWLEPSLALMQLATVDRVFLVDLSRDDMRTPVASLLEMLFSGEQPLLVGFAFQNDLRELGRSPWADVCRRPHGLCDLQQLSGRPQEGLSKLVERTLGMPLCKAEQRSYWHRRPLRAAQRHYAALDAFVLLQVASKLAEVPLSEPAGLASRLRDLSLLAKVRKE